MRITGRDLFRRIVQKAVDFFPAMGRLRMDPMAVNVPGPLLPKPSRGKMRRSRRSGSRKVRNIRIRMQKRSRQINWGLV